MILGPDGRPYKTAGPPRQRIRGYYDAAQTHRLNERHWAAADSLNPRDAANPRVRADLRKRARYLCYESSPTACGMIRTLALDTVRTGPRLQLIIPGWTNWAREIERRFRLWAYEAELVEHLITLCQAKRVDGEAFCAFRTNTRFKTPVKLSLEPFECDLVRGTIGGTVADDEDDGIVYDAVGNPLRYYVWNDAAGYSSYEVLPARDVIHLFRRDRPGQRRGIPEIATALELMAKSGRFTNATIHAAEAAANYAGVIFTDEPDDSEEAVDAEPGDVMEMNHAEWLVLPNGRKAQQFKAEHPTSTYAEFKRETTRDAARCVSQPYAIAAGDSSDSNYASGRLDFQTYDQSIDQERDYVAAKCLDRIFMAWYGEARLIRSDEWGSAKGGAIPDTLPDPSEWDWVWQWDKRQHVDPLKEANADKTLLSIGGTDRYRIAQRQGRDLDADDERAAIAYGVSLQEYRRALFLSTFPAAAPQAAASRREPDEETVDAD